MTDRQPRLVIAVPWRGGVASREFIWKQVRANLESYGYPVYTGDSNPDRPFRIAEARNAAAREAGDWDAVAFLDADTYLPKEQLAVAFGLALEGYAVLPYSKLKSMRFDGTSVPRTQLGNNQEWLNSGNVVMSRAVYERLGGWDERFTKYGWEDGALLWLAAKLLLLAEVPGTLVSIEHERTPDEDFVLAAHERPAVLTEHYDKHGPDETEHIRAARGA